MRALAELAMRGRLQATLACILFAALPFTHWLSAAIIGLVVLRRGGLEGSMVWMWTCLPLAAWFMANGDISPVLVVTGTGVLALVLRASVSWEITLALSVLVAAVASLLFETVSAGVFALVVDFYVEFFESMQQEITAEEARIVLVGIFAVGQAFWMIMALLLARWWQSALYNPGGFQKEFHGLRLSPQLSFGIVAVMVLFFALDQPSLSRWILLLTVPLVVSAIALVHWFVSFKELGIGVLVGFYLALLVIIQLVYPILTSISLMDSWMDVRKRLDQTKPN